MHPRSKKICFQHIKYSQINKYIYIGTNQCLQEHFSDELLKKGIEADISLEEKRLDSPFGVKFYLWLPTKDHRSPSFSQLKVGVAALAKLVEEKKKVYIHCKNGHGRAPTLAIAYLMGLGMNFKKAYNTIKKKRSEIHLHTDQIKTLKKLEKQYAKTNQNTIHRAPKYFARD